MLLCNHPDVDYQHACFDAYNQWIAEFCAYAPGPADRHGPDRAAHARRGHRRPRGDQGARPARRDAARLPPATPTTTTRCTTSSGTRSSTSASRRRSTSSPAAADTRSPERPRPEAQHVHVDHPRQPRHHRHVDLRRGVRASPRPAGRVRRGRRRLGAALDVPRRSRVRPSPQLARPPARSSKVPSEYFREHVYLTFQDDWVAFQMADLMNHERLHVGERLPAQRRHVAAQSGDARRARCASRRSGAGRAFSMTTWRSSTASTSDPSEYPGRVLEEYRMSEPPSSSCFVSRVSSARASSRSYVRTSPESARASSRF